MSDDRPNASFDVDRLREIDKEKSLYTLGLGAFLGKWIGELIDKLRIEEEMRSDLEIRVGELEMQLKQQEE